MAVGCGLQVVGCDESETCGVRRWRYRLDLARGAMHAKRECPPGREFYEKNERNRSAHRDILTR